MKKEKKKKLFKPVDLTQGVCWKTIIRFAIPVIISCLFQQIYTISDAAVVGQTLTDAAVAGVNDSSPLVFIFLQFAFGITAGFSVVTSAAAGSGDKERLRKSFAEQISLCLIVTLVLTALSVSLVTPLLATVGVTKDNAEIYSAAATYCTVIFAGIGAQLLYNYICSFLRGLGDSVAPLIFLVFSTLLNVGLDILFIVSFRWGVFGAAIATVIAQLLSAVLSFIYAFVKYDYIRPRLSDFKLTFSAAKNHLAQGLPLGLQFSVLSIGLIVMQNVVVRFDTIDGVIVNKAAQNGYGAACKLLNVLCTPTNALGIAMTSFTAQNFGAKNYDRIKKGCLQSLVIMLILCVLSSGAAFLCTINEGYMRLFLSGDKITEQTIVYGNSYVYIAFATFPLLAFIFLSRNCVQGIERPKFVLFAGVAELVARILVCVFLPSFFSGGAVSANSPVTAYYALCLADSAAWLAADIVLAVPFVKNILKRNFAYAEKKSALEELSD